MIHNRIIQLIASVLVLAGCGGGGGSESSETNGTTEFAKSVTIGYGNDGEIIFVWEKGDDTEQTLYSSLDSTIDESDSQIVAKSAAGSYTITCRPAQNGDTTLLYSCDGGASLTIVKGKSNAILLSGAATEQVGSIEILLAETKAK